MVPVRDVAAIAAAVDRLAGDAGLRRRLGDAASARARARFSHDRMAEELVAVLRR